MDPLLGKLKSRSFRTGGRFLVTATRFSGWSRIEGRELRQALVSMRTWPTILVKSSGLSYPGAGVAGDQQTGET